VETLTLAEVIVLHARLTQRTGGSGGVRDMGLLESALFLELNGYVLTASNQAVLEFTRQVAVRGMELAEMAIWLEAHSRPAEGSREVRR